MGNPPQQQPPSVGTTPCPPNAQPAPLPSVQNSPVDTRTKSKNGQGVKKSKSWPTDKPDAICWRCKQPGHLKCDCPMPPFCVKCRQEGHLPYNCPQQNNRNTLANIPAQTTVDHQFSNIRNKCIHCGVDMNPQDVQQRLGYTWLQPTRSGHRSQVLWVQVRIIQMCFLPSVQGMACQPLEAHHQCW